MVKLGVFTSFAVPPAVVTIAVMVIVIEVTPESDGA